MSITGSALISKEKFGQVVNIKNHKMILDPNNSLGLGEGIVYESSETSIIEEHVGSGEVVIDIGAHIGYFTLIFANRVGENGIVYAFEPNRTNYTILNKNIKLNNYSNVRTINKAVSSSSKLISLFICERNSGMHRTYKSICCRKSEKVKAVSLDDIYKFRNKRVGFIKIDIEGAEPYAFKGMIKLIQHSSPKILTEFSPAAIVEGGFSPYSFLVFISSLGYHIFDSNLKSVNVSSLEKELIYLEEQIKELLPSLHGLTVNELSNEVQKKISEIGYSRPVYENLFCIRK